MPLPFEDGLHGAFRRWSAKRLPVGACEFSHEHDYKAAERHLLARVADVDEEVDVVGHDRDRGDRFHAQRVIGEPFNGGTQGCRDGGVFEKRLQRALEFADGRDGVPRKEGRLAFLCDAGKCGKALPPLERDHVEEGGAVVEVRQASHGGKYSERLGFVQGGWKGMCFARFFHTLWHMKVKCLARILSLGPAGERFVLPTPLSLGPVGEWPSYCFAIGLMWNLSENDTLAPRFKERMRDYTYMTLSSLVCRLAYELKDKKKSIEIIDYLNTVAPRLRFHHGMEQRLITFLLRCMPHTYIRLRFVYAKYFERKLSRLLSFFLS